MNDRQRAILQGLYSVRAPMTAGEVGRRFLGQGGRRPDRPALNALRPLRRQGFVARQMFGDVRGWYLTPAGVDAVRDRATA